MHCLSCGTDISSWLNKYANQKKVYLDKRYFEENKVKYKEDERGMYISGETFLDVEIKKAQGKCPRCGKLVEEDPEDVQWGPI